MDKLVEIHNYRAMAKEMKRIADALETFVAVYSAKCHADGYTVPNPKLTAEERKAFDGSVQHVRDLVAQTAKILKK